METPTHQFNTRLSTSCGDMARQSLTAFVMKPVNVLDRSVRGTRVGHRGATGGAWPEPDAATRCHGARWEISYVPYTCVTCRLDVCLPDMKIVTRQCAARVGSVPGRRPPRSRRVAPSRSRRLRLADGHSPEGTREGAEPLRPDGQAGPSGSCPVRLRSWPFAPARRARLETRAPELLRRGMYAGRARCGCAMGIPCPASGERTSPPHPCPEPLPGAGARGGRRCGALSRPAHGRRRTGLSDATKVGEPAYPGYNPGAGEGLRPFEPEQPRAPVDCAGGGVAPVPPVAAQPDG